MSQQSIHDRIYRQARRALLERAFLRVENALIIAGAIVLGFFLPNPLPTLAPWWSWWTWALLGLIGVALVVASTLTDQAEAEKVVEQLFKQEYDIRGFHDRQLQEKLDRAEDYQEQISRTIRGQRDGLLKDRLRRTADQLYDWIGHMVRLARRIDAYRNDPIIQGDREELKASIPRLENRLKLESDVQVRSQVETTLVEKRRLASNIDELDSRMRRADLQLDSSLAALGTVYSQLLLVASKDVDSGRAERLQADIADEVNSLQDVVDSINEIYDYHTLGPGM